MRWLKRWFGCAAPCPHWLYGESEHGTCSRWFHASEDWHRCEEGHIW